LWQTTEKINGNDLYEVTVENPISKQAVTSYTKTVSPSLIRAPFFNNKSLFSLAPEYITFRATPGANVKAYDVVLEVTYDEFDAVDTSIKATKNAFWKVMSNYQVDQGDLIRQVEKEAFFQFMANTLTSGPNLKHRFVSFGVTYYSGSQNLIDYMSVNVPAIGIPTIAPRALPAGATAILPTFLIPSHTLPQKPPPEALCAFKSLFTLPT
jgi:hypothetical protein